MMDFIAMFFGAFVASLFGVWLLMWGLNGKAPETQADFNRLVDCSCSCSDHHGLAVRKEETRGLGSVFTFS